MKNVLRCFFVVCLFVCTSASAIPTEIVKKARDATVLVGHVNGPGMGSGVVISPDGLIITNYHVIHRAEGLRVFFYDPKNLNYYLAEVVGIDPVADLAIIKLNLPEYMLPLTYLEVETDYKIAQEVVAIGHPMGLQWSVTKGVINNLERPGKITPYVSIIQHSAQINTGNSGGPLIDEHGHVIGINTYIIGTKGQWSGVAYAIRGDTVLNSVEQMKETGEVVYPALKLGVRNVNEFFIKAASEANPNKKFPTNIFGLMATEVKTDEYAYSQGIRNFDVIVSVNGEPVNYLGDLKELMLDFIPGQVVKFIIIRDGHFRKLNYTITSIDFNIYLEWYDDKPTRPTPGRPD